jgi:hypothetical protein
VLEVELTAYSGADEPDLLTTRRVRLKGTRKGAPSVVKGGRAVRAVRKVELTDRQIEALLCAAEIAEASWWDDPAMQRRLAALARARRTLVAARRASPIAPGADHHSTPGF